ncbi:MAG: hypothetical protein CM15mP36_16650 [Flavobacteriales bacterium]|nr:MAG: hypothetical protein CM15mP36_16650 [Flavobacteriales bacterium]
MLIPGQIGRHIMLKLETDDIRTSGLGLLDKSDVQNESKEKPAYKKYFLHGTSHHMGIRYT